MKCTLQRLVTRGVGIFSLVSLILLFGNPTTVTAQRGRGGPQLEPEQAEAAWTLAARGVAKDLRLDDEGTAQLVDAYTTARASHRRSVELQYGAGDFQVYREIAEEERAKLETALNDFLKTRNVGKAMASLGTLSGEWDSMLHTLAGFDLGDKKLFKALPLLTKYVIDFDKARSKAIADQDFQSIRGARAKLKAKLDSRLAKILSKEQLTTWNETTAPRGPGGPGA